MKTVLAVGLVALVLLAGCGNTQEPRPSGANTAPTTTVAATSSPEGMSPRGNSIGRVGERVGISDRRTGETYLEWTITDITVDARCELDVSIPPANGHIVMVEIDVETLPEFDQAEHVPSGFDPTSSWSIVGADGYTQTDPFTDASAFCIEDRWPDRMSPSSKYRFRIAFDSASSSGVLMFRDRAWYAGWEWPFG